MPAKLSGDGLQPAVATRIANGGRVSFDDRVASEMPVAFVYNGEPHAVMMATPLDLEDFALGFALTEGVVADASEFELVDCTRTDAGISLQAVVPHARFEALRTRRRAMEGRAGCGLCGVETLDAAIRPVPAVAPGNAIPADAITAGIARLATLQPLNAASGGVHAAAWIEPETLRVREDVGRHNALDKLVGALARAPAGPGFLLMTSRASYEIVHKAATAGIAVVAALSAPTDLAIRIAERAGVTLVAFARSESMTIYTNGHRIEP
ncbi:MAG TPA: formate dehydrogenase accessory sulfurtransferase FdhD [Xanthomonadales bacterium]|nr:formate dehydrogenase accessory sulfurtransferase FdhD [Xanthomonadales bacterium]